MNSESLVLFVGVDEQLWNSCFGNEELWSDIKIERLGEDCEEAELEKALALQGLQSVVVQGTDTLQHRAALRNYYQEQSGFIVFFGIYGEFQAPTELSELLGVKWRFSAYTSYEYLLSDVGKEVLGYAVQEQQYSKANLVDVPKEDRILIPKGETLQDYIDDHFDSDEEDNKEEAVQRIEKEYEGYVDRLHRQVPVALHRAKHGGQVAYLGFVNGDGNIPKFVRALCTHEKVRG